MKKDITKESNKRLLYLIRLGHPNGKGESYCRSEVIKEIENRGLKIFKSFGWSIDLNHIYKNRYTGTEETLKQLFEGGYSKLKEETWSIMEHWTDLDFWDDSSLFDEYNAKFSKEDIKQRTLSGF